MNAHRRSVSSHQGSAHPKGPETGPLGEFKDYAEYPHLREA